MSTTIDTSPASAPARPEAVARPGKSDQAIGHQAKRAIADAGAVADLPKNIQGQVASTLARGLSLDSILSLQPAQPGPTSEPPTDSPADDAVVSDTDGIADASPADSTVSDNSVSDSIASDTLLSHDATALELLSDADEPAA